MPTTFAPPSRRTAILAVLAVAFAVYANTLGHGLVYDDKVIVQNAAMHDPWNLARIFGRDFYGGTHAHVDLYRPLTVFSFALNWWANELFGAAGQSPFLFHLTNVLLHAAASALVFVLVERLSSSRWLALAAALLFAVHPLHTEPVANVYARSELLAAVFGLAFLCLYRNARPILAAIALFLAVSSKESAVVYLPVAFVLDLWLPVDGRRVRFASLALGGAALGVWAIARASALAGHDHDHEGEEMPFVENPLVRQDDAARIASALKVQLVYLRLLALPITLSSDYSFDQVPVATGFGDPHVLGFLGVTIAAIALAVLARRSWPLVGFCVSAYAIAWLPTANVLFPIGTILGERLAYTPSIFACVLAAALLELVRTRFGTGVFLASAGALVLLGATRSVLRNPVWKDEPTLFRDQVATAPNSVKARMNLGSLLSGAGDRASAMVEFERAVAIQPGNARAHFRLANELYLTGTDLARADASYRRAAELEPTFLDPRVNRCYLLLSAGRLDDARAAIDEVRRLAPKHRALPELDGKLRAATSAKPPGGN